MIDEDPDAEVGRFAAVEGRSDAALTREYVGERPRPLPPLSTDPLYLMAGADDYERTDIDDVVYP